MHQTSGEELPPGLFHARPEHCPSTREELHERLNYYTSWMGVAASDALYDCLIAARQVADKLPDEEVRQLALKSFSDEEYSTAVKEILCIWFHLEAMDQGGENAPPWLLSFIRLAFNASDFLIAEPKARAVMHSYEDHIDISSLCRAAATRTCQWLGFGPYSPGFAAAVERIFSRSAPQRQQILEESLTLPLATMRSRPLP
jgi:hypothetical protein